MKSNNSNWDKLWDKLWTNSESGQCPSDPLVLKLKFIKKPIINPTRTTFNECESVDEVTLDGISLLNVEELGIGTGVYDIQWSITSGFGTLLTSPETLEAVYDPAGNDVENGVTLTLTAYGKGDCGFIDQQSFQINFTREVIINPGDGGSVCSGESFTIYNASIQGLGENENYRWVANYAQDQSNSQSPDGYFINQGKLEPTYVPGNEDINRGLVYLFLEPVNIPGSCYFTPGPVALEINSEISLSAGPNLEVCGDYGEYFNWIFQPSGRSFSFLECVFR